MRNQPFTILLHIALAIILAGASVTHFFGIQGSLTLYAGETPTDRFMKESGPGDGRLPFHVGLEKVEIEYYPATTTPMDYRSILKADGNPICVAMNKVGEYRGWRFYQSGMSEDSTTLSVSHDPWGTGITYTGYALLAIGMLGFFFQRNTAWRATLRRYRKGIAQSLLLISLPATAYGSDLPAMQRPLAANLGKALVYWNGRVCPIQTMARDVTTVLYGSDTYDGLTAEQVLSGWLFHYDHWERDYLQNHPELMKVSLIPASGSERKAAERLGLIQWMGTGEAFRVYPYQTVDGHMEWLSLTARKPSGITLEQWKFMQTTLPEIKKLLQKGQNVKANEKVMELISGQRIYGGDVLPSSARIRAERTYNSSVRPLWCGLLCILDGLLVMLCCFFGTRSAAVRLAGAIGAWVALLYVGYAMALMWYVGGHVPVSNGPETMMFLALVALTGAAIPQDSILRGALMTVAGMALLVAAMGGQTPQIGAMMPVLASPLLSVHVMVVMTSYSLFLLMAILAALALSTRSDYQRSRLSTLNRLMLAPAVCLLGAGIFIGAVWANQTWGRYWGWDPKETCALVMWLVYALPLHSGIRQLRIFLNEKPFNIYLLLAVLTVAFTYFGANYLLKGLHSYA